MLVVNPNHRVNSPYAAVEPPLWAGLIASHHNSEILDAEALDYSVKDTVQAIYDTAETSILLVVMGNNPSVSSTPKYPVALEIAKQLKDLDVRMTGIHPIAVGSEYPVLKEPFYGTPMMPWNKFPMNLYRAHNWHCLDGSERSPYASVYTSLGCPHNCYYCNIHTLYGDRQIRFRPISDILKEIDTLALKYHVKNIKFWDELFALRQDRVVELCGHIAERGYDLNIWAYARLDTITEKMLKAMKLAGINWLAYGFESVKDKKFVSQTDAVIDMTRFYGINIIANFMFGLPGTTREDDKASLDFAKEHLFEYVNFYDAKPYPGSKWYEDTKPECDFDQYHDISPFRQRAFQDYFTNPEYISMVDKKWGVRSADHIRSMSQWQMPVR